ncbi:uncharacterized protein LOC126741239 [Anthonomus grandis grandis]|uniref:uncharacterized protein LOC126741239 n=1 Tax=Anthonomus grandis grandis TaxID=2921223 RepID=UPI0021661634|nr:uncharacterized protein LOC126741239 [Anthonomus grandis grandis]
MASDSSSEEDSVPCHWGEIPENPRETDHQFPDISQDIKRSMQKTCLDSYQETEEFVLDEIRLPPLDPLVLHAIKLHKWMNNMLDTIRLAEVAKETNVMTEDVKIPIPEMPEVKLRHKTNKFNYMPARSSRGPNPEDVELIGLLPDFSDQVIKIILRKSVAILFAQIGFEESSQSVLDTMVDVLEEFFLKICNRIASAVREEDELNTGGFPNVAERALVELGFGGARNLHNYYQSRVVKYVQVLQKRCRDLERYYLSLIVPKSDSPSGEIGKCFLLNIKKETEDDAEETCTEGDLITSSYKLLINLESAMDTMDDLSEGGGEQHQMQDYM